MARHRHDMCCREKHRHHHHHHHHHHERREERGMEMPIAVYPATLFQGTVPMHGVCNMTPRGPVCQIEPMKMMGMGCMGPMGTMGTMGCMDPMGMMGGMDDGCRGR